MLFSSDAAWLASAGTASFDIKPKAHVAACAAAATGQGVHKTGAVFGMFRFSA